MNQPNKKYNLSLTSKEISFEKNIPSTFKNTKFSKAHQEWVKNMVKNENNTNKNILIAPTSVLFFNTSFLENMSNPELTLQEKVQSLIQLIKTYQFWINDNSNSYFSQALFVFLFDPENKELLKNIIDSDESYFLKYNFKFYKEFREYKENIKNFAKDKSVLLFKKKRFQKYEENREHYTNNFYINKNNNNKIKLFDFIDNFVPIPLLQIIEIIVNVSEDQWYDIFTKFGYLNILKFLFFYKPHIKYTLYSCQFASLYGQLECLQFLHEIVKAPWNKFTCSAASRGGNLDCLKYAHEKECDWDEWVCKVAAQYGHLNCLMYAHENECPWDKKTCIAAAEKGQLDCLIYAHENGCPWDNMTCIRAAFGGHLDCLKYAHEKACPWNKFTCSIASREGNLDCLIYAHENGCPWEEDTCKYAADNGHINCLMYAHENGCPWNKGTCSGAAFHGHLNCLIYAHENDCPWDILTCNQAAMNGHLNCLEYAICNGCDFDYINYNIYIQHFIDNLDCLQQNKNIKEEKINIKNTNLKKTNLKKYI